MSIPTKQLETWAHQGAVSTSSQTYNRVRTVLLNPSAPYANKDIDVYLQGSYGNDTNIYSESDVDVVIQLNSTFNSNKGGLPEDQLACHDRDYRPATYCASDLRKDVIRVLSDHYGWRNVEDGRRSVKLLGVTSLRKTDVVVCTQYRHYSYYYGPSQCSFVEGIMINNQGESVINYPKLHSAALTYKHQQTNGRFKPLVRVLKNIKARLVSDGYVDEKTAASYNLECWLYNAPNELYVCDLRTRFVNVCNWLMNQDSSVFMMPHGQFKLIGLQNNQWNNEDLKKFSRALIAFDEIGGCYA